MDIGTVVTSLKTVYDVDKSLMDNTDLKLQMAELISWFADVEG